MAEIITGMSAFEAKLKALDYALQRQALIKAAKAGAEILAEEASRLAPSLTGALSEGIGTSVRTSQSDIHEATVDVGPKREVFYGFFVETGTDDTPAQPFMAPAIENKRAEITQAMKDELERQIKKVAA